MARRKGFAHLHVHTVHSTLDAMTQHEEMCDEVLADAEATGAELAAIASTDHGTLSGTYKFSRMARKRGVTPLFGNEMYLANGLQEGARFAKDGLIVAADGAELDGDKADGGTGKRKTKRYEHITLLAETEEGWRNLIRINNAAQAPDAKWGKPRADIDLICQHSEGIIALTGCLGGPVLGSVARGDVDRARGVLRHMLTNGFDRDHLFLEIMEHGIPQEAKAMRTMLDLGDEFEIAPVATNDAHFAVEDHAHAHEAWLCNATKAKFSDPDRWKFHGEGYWLRSAAEMRAIFDADERTQMACDNTLLIAERIAASGDIMTPSELRLPEFPVPSDYVPSTSAQRKGLTGSAAYLNDQIREGAIRRYGSPLPAEVRDRLTYEFDVIYSMGLGDYFLIVQDLIAAARREGIRVGPGRGCLDGDSLIWTTDGYKKIRDIAIGDLVRTHTGAIRPVEMTFRYDVDEPLYTIRSYADGQGVSMTGDHKVLVRRCSTETDVRRLRSGATFDQGLGTGPEWVRSDSVSPGDLMCIPRPPSPGTGATVIDVAALLPQDTRGTLVTVTDDEIIEVVPSNKAFRGSIRDVSMRHGIARNVIKTALGPFREPKHAARRPGLLAKYEATVARLSAALASDGWNSTEEWDEYRQSRDRITVVTPRFIPADDNLLFLIGAFASNGWLRSDSIRSVGFAEQRSQSDDTIPLAVKRVWGIEATSHPHASTDLVQWDVRSLAVRALFRKLMPDYGMKAQTKHLPSFVDDLSIDQKRSLLDGLWWGDGSRSEHRWSYSTTSPELMRQVRDLLWAIGAPAGVTVDDRTDTRKGFENRTRAWKIRTTPGFAPHAAQFGGTDDNYVYSRVREVTGSLPVAEVFDFQVGTDHSFMTDSYVVHNSAAGCAISYCLDIVNIDPIRYNLLFERFLNPERIGMPDIDIDFESSGRDWAFGYLASRYGVDRVARIGSFGIALSKGAIRAAARVLSAPSVGDDLSAAVPTNKNGKPQSFAEFMDPQNPSGDEFRRRVAQSDTHQAVAELAESWEGGIDKEGVHACGVIIGRDPLDGEVPLRDSKGFWVTQWDGKDLDALQFLKLDALALRNLDVVTAAERLIEQTTGERIDADNPSLDPHDSDPVVAERVAKTFELLQAGKTAGVFQLESGGITELCVQVGPTTLDDIAAIVALYRPGPLEAKMEERYALRKNGLETVDYGIFSPDRNEQTEIAKVLDETFGVPAYQEQLMRLGDVVAGFGPIERNRLQKAVSKKLQAEMAAVGELFISGAMAEVRDDDGTVTKMAFRRDTAEKVWAAIKGAGNYAFNASHSYAYGWVTYITAYLKANWPTQYGAALLSVTKKADKRHEMLLSLAAEGIEVVAPRINEAKVDTTVNAQGQVVIGMNEVRDVSREDAEIIVAARAAGPFTSLSDFAQRCLDPALENRVKIGAFEGLIEAGSFDEFGPEGRTCRMGMLLIARAVGQRTDLVPFDCEWNHLERARREARRLGVLVSPNPTKFLAEHIRGANIGGIKPSPLRRADEQKAGDEFTTAAIVSSWSEQQGHWGSRADILLTGTGAAVRATAWDKTLAKIRAIAEAKGGSPAPKVGDLVLVRGKIVMRKARLENENGEMVDGEAIAEETAEISVWDIRVVPVPGDHFDVPAGPSGTTEHWFVRPDGYVDPEPGPVPCGALDQVIVDGGLPFAAAAETEAGGSESDLEAVPAAELLVEEVDGDLPNEPPVGPVEPVRPPDRFEVTAYTTPFGEALAMAPGVVEMPWAPGEVDTIVVEFANGTLGGTSGASAALRQKRPELAGFLTAVVRLQRRPASSTEDIATEIRPLVDEAVAGRPVEIVAYGAPIPRSTWVIPSADVPGVAAAAWAEMLAAPVEPSIELADALAHRPAA